MSKRKPIEIGDDHSLSTIRFQPDHLESIAILITKVAGDRQLWLDGDILDLDIYDEYQLPRLFMAAKYRNIYFFTRLRKMGKMGKTGLKQAIRKVGNGTWHGESKNDVKHDVHGVVGTIHTFKFNCDKPGYGHDGLFLMSEYHLLEGVRLKYNPLEDPVFCVLKYKHRSELGLQKRKR